MKYIPYVNIIVFYNNFEGKGNNCLENVSVFTRRNNVLIKRN